MDYFSSLNASALDPDTPTLFELFSSRELDALIGPSIRYIVTFYAQRHPRYLLRLATKFDEIYALVFGIVEYYHLKNWNSTFTEKFYGLKRARVLNSGAGSLPRARVAAPNFVEKSRRLSNKQIWASVLITILGPYIKEKMEIKHQRLQARALVNDINAEYQRAMAAPTSRADAAAKGYDLSSDDLQIKTRSEKLTVFIDYWFYKIYPYYSGGHAAITLLFYLMYLFNRAATATCLSDWLLGIQYARMGQYDYMLADERAGVSPTLSNDTFNTGADAEEDTPFIAKVVNFFTTRKGVDTVQDGVLSTLSYALPTSMFLLKFLEWWSASDVASKLASKSTRGILDGNLPVMRGESELYTVTPQTEEPDEKKMLERDSESEDDEENEKEETRIAPVTKKTVRLVRDTSLCPLCGTQITNPTAIESGVVFCYPCIYKHLESVEPPSEYDTDNIGGHCPVTGIRLLQCRYSHENQSWEIGGLRRLMI